MLVRIVRTIPFREVVERIAKLEKKYHGDVEGSDLFSSSKLDRQRFEDCIEWLRMRDAVKAYSEGEDFDYFVEETVEVPQVMISELTPKRIELMDEIARASATSINNLASKTKRDVKNIYIDLKILEKVDFVSLRRQGRRVIPELKAQEITLFLA